MGTLIFKIIFFSISYLWNYNYFSIHNSLSTFARVPTCTTCILGTHKWTGSLSYKGLPAKQGGRWASVIQGSPCYHGSKFLALWVGLLTWSWSFKVETSKLRLKKSELPVGRGCSVSQKRIEVGVDLEREDKRGSNILRGSGALERKGRGFAWKGT